MSRGTAFVVGFTLLALAAAFLLPPMPQPLDYHDFADQRDAFGVENFLDVVTNAAFLLAGLAGLFVVLSGRAVLESPAERWPWAVFFLGVLLTAAGSAWYHLSPDNETLFWDRLPMTVAFMALVASQVVDRISVRAGLRLLVPMLLVGAASVIYWIATERAGAGNVLPYGILQGYSVIVLLLMAVLKHSRYTRGNDLYFIFGWYVLAKLLETFDEQVLALGHLVSGHSLKHVAAAVGGFVACRMLVRRRLVDQGREVQR
ncbi:MAG: alkaline phytoceramidase [Chromatiales bacterium]|nr:alkaline phytoceramidase [Chromatiales bacterium]